MDDLSWYSSCPYSLTPLSFSFSGCSVKRAVYQNLLSKRCSKILIPKPFPNNQWSGRVFIIGLTSRKMLAKFIDSWYMTFLLDMYNKDYALNFLNLMRSVLNFFFFHCLAMILPMLLLFLDCLVYFIKRGLELPNI